MKRIIFISIMVLLSVNVFAQTVFLTFTGRDSYGQHVPLDSVLIRNLTRGWQQSFFWPDSSFFIMQVGTGIDDYYEANISPMFQLSQNSPNPFNGTTSVQLTIVEPGAVTVEITDISGRIVELKRYPSLQPGVHKLRISLSSPGVYFLTARIDGHTSSVKMINQGVGSADMIDYQGMVNESGNSSDLKSASKSINSYPFQLGDEMEYVGFSTAYNMRFESEHVIQTQNETQTIGLNFTFSLVGNDAQPCSGMPTVTDIDGNVYNTVQIGSQCWLKENLRTTKYADGTSIAESDSICTTTAYWCRPLYSSNVSDSVSYGLLYNWKSVFRDEPVSTTNTVGFQGVCPDGWHVPSDYEWTQLTDYVSGQSVYLCGSDSSNIAKALAANIGWNYSTNHCDCCLGKDLGENNRTGFSALPAGRIAGWSYYTGILTMFWSSTIVSNEDVLSHYGCDTASTWSWYREMGTEYDGTVGRGIGQEGCFFSVRCLQDSENYNSSANTQPSPIFPTVLDCNRNIHNNERVGSQIRIKENQCTMHDSAGNNITSGNKISVTKAY